MRSPLQSAYKQRLIELGYEDVANDEEQLQQVVKNAKAIADLKKVRCALKGTHGVHGAPVVSKRASLSILLQPTCFQCSRGCLPPV